MTDYTITWQEAAADALAVIMARPAAWGDALDAGVTAEDVPPGHWRTVWIPVIEAAAALKEPRALLATEIAAVTGVPITWLYETLARYDEYAEKGFVATLQTLLAYGKGTRQLNTVTRARGMVLAALNTGTDTDPVIEGTVGELQAEHGTGQALSVGLDALMVENRAAMEADPLPKTPTGIGLIDDWLGGGLSSNAFVAWVAPYKSRKTAVMVNAILAATERGKQVNVFIFDELRSDFIYRLEAALMAKYMWDTGQYTHPLNAVDMEMIRDAGKNWRNWSSPMPQAFEFAFDTLSSWGKHLRVYDAQTCKATVQAIGGHCRMDAQRRGLDNVYIDHLQRLKSFGRIFENVEYGSDYLNTLRGELGCKLWLLSQQNEEAIKGGDTTGQHSPNVKGGGGLASSADDIFVSKYRREPHPQPDVLKVELRLSRHHESGVMDYVEIHPASGWITPRRNVVTHIDLQGLQNATIEKLD